MVKMHKDYSSEYFVWDKIENAWQTITGTNSIGRYFFIAHLKKIPFGGGRWMAYLRRPGIKSIGEDDGNYLDVPFQYQGFEDVGDAHNAVFDRAYMQLGWRIEEIDVNMLPTEIDENTKGLLNLVNNKV